MSQIELLEGTEDRVAKLREAVQATLSAVLDSPHFRKSKRYPALLHYVVWNTLDGNFSALKERIIGAAVFGRPNDYDTNEDPVVRITAGEVRKRMALYFSEHLECPVRIILPVGSYIACFEFPALPHCPPYQAEEAAPELRGEHPAPLLFPVEKPARLRGRLAHQRWLWILSSAAILLLVAGGTRGYLQERKNLDLWSPVLRNAVPAMILVAPSVPASGLPNGNDSVRAEMAPSADHELALADAVAAAEVCGVFGQHGHACAIEEAQEARLGDLRKNTIVLIGAFHDPWTQRLMAPLRYQFAPARSGGAGDLRSIVDRRSPAVPPQWFFDPAAPPEEAARAYSIVARFHSDLTDSIVIVAAGISAAGTRSAGECVTSPQIMRQLLARAPKGWSGTNFEAVLQTDIVQGRIGHAEPVAVEFW